MENIKFNSKESSLNLLHARVTQSQVVTLSINT